METFRSQLSSYLNFIHMPNLRWTDIVEILIIAFLAYHIMLWIKNTRAYSLLRGILVIVVFIFLAALFNMTTILWIVQNVTQVAVMAIVVILQPELRRAMEALGQKDLFASLFRINLGHGEEGLFSDKTITELVRACTAMARVRTGALIVIEQNIPLDEYERTGIEVDGLVTSQLLINIFEKNTPLHDGAVIIRHDRVMSATCYLPLSGNHLDKDLGTRHRAGVGVSEVTDSLTIIVSEETGQISTAYKGVLHRNVDAGLLKEELVRFQNKRTSQSGKRGIFMPWKGKDKDEE